MTPLPLDEAALDLAVLNLWGSNGPGPIASGIVAQARAALALAAQVERLEAERAKVRADALREAAALCDKAVPRAHTYASENADLYRAGDDARDRCKAAILRLAAAAQDAKEGGR